MTDFFERGQLELFADAERRGEVGWKGATKHSPNYHEDCPHCRNYKDGGGCAFHEASAAHYEGRCLKGDRCFFCP